MANPAVQPSFAMVTNGDEILFVKLVKRQYAVSRVYAPFSAAQELYVALQILKQVQNKIKSDRFSS
jgi:hypothetical protein